MSEFLKRIERACGATQSLVCVGLDPDPAQMPVADTLQFNRAIIDATADLVGAYKPNLAFYEALGRPGLEALADTVQHIRDAAPDVLIIGDAKRGDIGSSAQAYARALFGVWGFDAVTVNPWGGADAVAPFLEDATRGAFVWCRGSNPGSADFQDAAAVDETGPAPLYQRVAQACREWNRQGNVGLVVGATVPEQLQAVRQICPDMPLLIPGVGAQGGDLEAAVRAGVDAAGRRALINSSRGIIYAAAGPGFAQAAREAAARLRQQINRTLAAEGRGWPTN